MVFWLIGNYSFCTVCSGNDIPFRRDFLVFMVLNSRIPVTPLLAVSLLFLCVCGGGLVMETKHC